MNKAVVIFQLYFIFCGSLFSQEMEKKITITDTIYSNTLKVHHLIVNKCPGYLSGEPCSRFIQYIGTNKISKKSLRFKDDLVTYTLKEDDIIVINIKKIAPYSNLFDGLYIETKSNSAMELSECLYKKGKTRGFEAIYLDAKIYVAQISKKDFNDLNYYNIQVDSEDTFITAYLIFN